MRREEAESTRLLCLRKMSRTAANRGHIRNYRTDWQLPLAQGEQRQGLELDHLQARRQMMTQPNAPISSRNNGVLIVGTGPEANRDVMRNDKQRKQWASRIGVILR